MPHVVLTERAIADLERFRLFLSPIDKAAAQRAGQEIERRLNLLATSLESGRPYEGDRTLRELSIKFGKAGYVALYLHSESENAVYVLAVRHQRELDY